MLRVAATTLTVLALLPAGAHATRSAGGTAPVDPARAGGASASEPADPAPDAAPAIPAADAAQPPSVAGQVARLARTGLARAPRGAPGAVRQMVAAANLLQDKPYRYGGGHARFDDDAYDCSGTVSFALRGAGLLPSPLDSTGFMAWGEPGPGRWVTIYANPGHAFMTIAGLRLDTSGTGGRGPRWRPEPRSVRGFVARHPPGL